MVSKKGVIISITTLTIICTVLASITVVNAGTGGIAQYWDGTQWQDIYPELYVMPGDTVKIRILDLPAGFNDADLIEFNIALSGWGNDYGPPQYVTVTEYALDKHVTAPIEWTSSVDLEYCNTYTIKYRTNDLYPEGAYVAQGTVNGPPWGGHLHAIPEFAFGTITSILSLLSGLGIYSKFRK